MPVQQDRLKMDSRVLLLGSCFSEVVGRRLQGNKLCAAVNPFGVIFNPISILTLMELAMKGETVPEHTYLKRGELHCSYLAHSDFSESDLDLLKLRLNKSMNDFSEMLENADCLFLTFGTSIVYTTRKSGLLVANCHKQPAAEFEKRFLKVGEIVERAAGVFEKLKSANPKLKIILTVSPVRHTKEGIENNQVSKSILRLACEELKQQFGHVRYFPSYELLLDDLRDYRFFSDDLVHPSMEGEEYVWEKFAKAYLSDEVHDFIKKWTKLKRAVEHRPFHPETLSHQKFVRKTIEQLRGLESTVDVEQEIRIMQGQLKE